MKKAIFYFIVAMLISHKSMSAQEQKKIIVNNDIQLIELQDSVYMHITWNKSEKMEGSPPMG